MDEQKLRKYIDDKIKTLEEDIRIQENPTTLIHLTSQKQAYLDVWNFIEKLADKRFHEKLAEADMETFFDPITEG